MNNINEIQWHDCELESVVEIPSKDMLIFNVQYPEDWKKNIFVSKGIFFEGYHSQVVNEIPFEGNPTILGASVVNEEKGFTIIRLDTNAGHRLVTAKSIFIDGQVCRIGTVTLTSIRQISDTKSAFGYDQAQVTCYHSQYDLQGGRFLHTCQPRLTDSPLELG